MPTQYTPVEDSHKLRKPVWLGASVSTRRKASRALKEEEEEDAGVGLKNKREPKTAGCSWLAY